MNTSSINHRPATVVVVAGLASALLAVGVASAHAIPDPDDPPPAIVDRTVHNNGTYVERACFMQPLTWNEALDGPLPRCYTYVP